MNGQTTERKVGAALVLGGGIGGMQAALDLAESGFKVYLADSKPSIGGVMSQLDKIFPTNDCAMCTMAPRLVGISRHKDIEIMSLADIEKIEGEAGNFRITLSRKARYVDEARGTGCGTCVSSCPTRYRVQPTERAPVEVRAQFRRQAEEIVERNRQRDGPLMPIPEEANAAFNYLPQDVLRYVSEQTGYPLSHILRIATFYSAFSIASRGKYTISVCMGTTCYVRGSERLIDKLSEILGIRQDETTPTWSSRSSR